MSIPIWLLPQGVSEILPQDAAKLEKLRRSILDELQQREFDLVFPPMIEFIDNLIQGAGVELTTQTFKVPDYDSHKTLGIRADMTPQLAQIDAHRLSHNAINRLCYIGTVLRTKPMTLGGSRELLQLGAEIFGDDSIEADKKIIDAMLSVHHLADLDNVTISLSHIGIFTALIDSLDIKPNLEKLIYDALLRKSTPDVRALDKSNKEDLSAFIALSKCRGGVGKLTEFKQTLPSLKGITNAIDEINQLVEHLANQTVNIHIDLSELHGYRYHSGLTFQTFIPGEGRAIAKGGRYFGLGATDKPRAATGFSADLKLLASQL